MATNVRTANKVTRSSGNIFADLELPNAPEHELKARLVLTLDRTIKAQGLTQTAAAERLASLSPTCPRSFAATSADFHWSGCSAQLQNSAAMWRSRSRRAGAITPNKKGAYAW